MISFHLQRTVPDWPRAVDKLPNGSVFKDVHLVQTSQEAYQHNNTLLCIHREWYDHGQTYEPGSANMTVCRNRADVFYKTFINQTFRELARSIRWVETWNETLANSQTAEEIQWRINQELAMCQIWEEQYQADFQWMGLMLANTAVGNNIPSAYAEMAHRSNWKHGISYHGYVPVYGGSVSFDATELASATNRPTFRDGTNLYLIDDVDSTPAISFSPELAGQPVPGEWAWASGRWAVMADQWKQLGFKNFYIVNTEGGPVRSVNGGGMLDPLGGWRDPRVCGGDPVQYANIMRYWAQKTAAWNAVNNQRCLGVTVFTTANDTSGVWQYFETRQPEMDALTVVANEYPPGTVVVPPPPPPTNPCVFPVETRRQLLHPQVLSLSQRQQIDEWLSDGIPNTLLSVDGVGNTSIGTYGWSHTDQIIAIRDALLAGKTDSLWVVVDGQEIGSGLNQQWIDANCPVVAPRTRFLKTFQLLQWPTPYTSINQRFGVNPENYAQFGLPGHDGVDIHAVLDDPIKACVFGTVVLIDDVGSTPLGKFVRVRSVFNGITHVLTYCHLNRVNVVINQVLAAGNVVGLAGSTGNSTGVHLHIGYKQMGRTYKTQEGVVWPSNIHDPSPLLAKLQPNLF